MTWRRLRAGRPTPMHLEPPLVVRRPFRGSTPGGAGVDSAPRRPETGQIMPIGSSGAAKAAHITDVDRIWRLSPRLRADSPPEKASIQSRDLRRFSRAVLTLNSMILHTFWPQLCPEATDSGGSGQPAEGKSCPQRKFFYLLGPEKLLSKTY